MLQQQMAPAAPQMSIIAPDLMAQQMQAQRQQQIAQMLMEQGNSPTDQQVIGGWAIKQNPMQNISKLAQILSGTYLQHDADTKSVANNIAQGKALNDWYNKAYGTGQQASGQQNSAGSPSNGAPNDVNSPAVNNPQSADSQSSQSPNDRLLQTAKMLMIGGNTQGSNALMENALTQTPEQKNNYAMGIDYLLPIE